MRVKRMFIAGAAVAGLALGASSMASAVPGNDYGTPVKLSGAHYNLNIIGVPHDKTSDMKDNNGGRIFVDLNGGTRINLTESETGDFQVLDANGTDGIAEFELPLPAECYATNVAGDIQTPASCTVSYTVWARALGKPDGSAQMKTCVEDPDLPGGYLCSIGDYTVTLTSDKTDRNTFQNVTKELLFVSANFDLDPQIEHVQIFDPMFDSYYWQYDNNGLKLAQLRFYMGDYTINW